MQTITIFILSVIIGAMIHQRQVRKKKQRKDLKKIFAALNAILDTNADRAIILKAVPNPSRNRSNRKYFGFVEFELYKAPLKTAHPDWNKHYLDKNYIKFLIDLSEEPERNLYTEIIQSEDLRTLFKSQNIVKATIFKLYENKQKIIYLSINYVQPPDEKPNPTITNQQELQIQTAVNTLRNIFNQNPDL